MKLEETDRKVLKYLCRRYVQRHGSRIVKLDEFSISVLENGLRSAVPELYSNNPSSGLPDVKEAFRELALRGLVKIHGNNQRISITKKGFNEVAPWWRKSDWRATLKTRKGLGILISLLGLIVGVISIL